MPKSRRNTNRTAARKLAQKQALDQAKSVQTKPPVSVGFITSDGHYAAALSLLSKRGK